MYLLTCQTGFADWGPYLVTTSESLTALNKHLTSPVTVGNFRPNIVVAGTDAWEEVGHCETHRFISFCILLTLSFIMYFICFELNKV